MIASSTSGCIANISPLHLRRQLSLSIGQKVSGSARGWRWGYQPARLAGFVSDPSEAAATQKCQLYQDAKIGSAPCQ